MSLKPEDRTLYLLINRRESALLLILPYQRIKELVRGRIRKLKSITEELKREIASVELLQVVPIIVGSLGIVTRNLNKWLGKLVVNIDTSLLQKTTLLGTARILRKV